MLCSAVNCRSLQCAKFFQLNYYYYIHYYGSSSTISTLRQVGSLHGSNHLLGGRSTAEVTAASIESIDRIRLIGKYTYISSADKLLHIYILRVFYRVSCFPMDR